MRMWLWDSTTKLKSCSTTSANLRANSKCMNLTKMKRSLGASKGSSTPCSWSCSQRLRNTSRITLSSSLARRYLRFLRAKRILRETKISESKTFSRRYLRTRWRSISWIRSIKSPRFWARFKLKLWTRSAKRSRTFSTRWTSSGKRSKTWPKRRTDRGSTRMLRILSRISRLMSRTTRIAM